MKVGNWGQNRLRPGFHRLEGLASKAAGRSIPVCSSPSVEKDASEPLEAAAP
ncbi:MAG: hypothetical protein PVF89_01795 [Lysobacterales bacterium]